MFIRDSTVITTKHHIMTKVGSDDSAIKAWIVLNYLLNEYSDIGAMWLMCLERWKCVWISATVGLFNCQCVLGSTLSAKDIQLRSCINPDSESLCCCSLCVCVCVCVCVCERQCKYCPAAQPL